MHHEYVFTSPEINPPPVEPKLSDNGSTQQRRLIPFNDVAGYTGVFVAGPQPALLVCSCKSFVRVHPVKVETNDIVGFTQFHNVNCEHGFITLDSNVSMRSYTQVASLYVSKVIFPTVKRQIMPSSNRWHYIRYGLGTSKGANGTSSAQDQVSSTNACIFCSGITTEICTTAQ